MPSLLTCLYHLTVFSSWSAGWNKGSSCFCKQCNGVLVDAAQTKWCHPQVHHLLFQPGLWTTSKSLSVCVWKWLEDKESSLPVEVYRGRLICWGVGFCDPQEAQGADSQGGDSTKLWISKIKHFSNFRIFEKTLSDGKDIAPPTGQETYIPLPHS